MAGSGGESNDAQLDYSKQASKTNNSCCLSALNNSIPELGRWSIWRALLLGQIASLLICVTAACCHLLNKKYDLQLPAAVGFINYALLCLIYTTWLACRSEERSLLRVVKKRGFKYFLVALIDVEANYLVLRAYQYTSITSVQLLDCFVVPVVLASSWLFLKVRYRLVHVLGVGLCLLGVGCLVLANVGDGKVPISGSKRLMGDMMCLAGATLYGISNVVQEYVVKTYDAVEFLGMMGLFGSLINGIQLGILERDQVGSVRWDTWPVLALVGGFTAAQFLFYVLTPCILRSTSATALNLALFTTDFYVLITGIALFEFKQFHPLYFLSYLLVVTGVIVFVIKPTPIHTASQSITRHRHSDAPGTATSSVGVPTSFNDWPPLADVRGCPDYPHSHSSNIRTPGDYSTLPPSPPQQFRSLPRPQKRDNHPRGGPGDKPNQEVHQQRAATLARPPKQFYRSNGSSASTHDLGDVRC